MQVPVTTPAAAGVTVSAAASAPAVVPTPARMRRRMQSSVQAAASEAAAAPVQQPATQSVATAATAATDLALTAAVAATRRRAKTTLLKAPVTAPAKTATSSAAASRPPDPSDAATPRPASDNIAPPPAAAARPDAGNAAVERREQTLRPAPHRQAGAPTRPMSIRRSTRRPHAPADHQIQPASGGHVPATVASAPPPLPPASLNVTAASKAAVPLSGLAVEIAASARSGKSRFEIRLDPADLGRIDVRIDVDRNGQVTSHLTVEKPETLSMLRQDAPQLQRALDDAGLEDRQWRPAIQPARPVLVRPERQRNRPQRAAAGHQRRRYHPRGGRRTKLWPHARIEQRRGYQGLRRAT